MISARTRELGFLVPGLLVGLLGAATVASARADALEYGPVAGAVAVVVVFGVMHLVLRWRAPLADPYLLPLIAMLIAIGLVELDRIRPSLARDQLIWVAIGGAVFVAVLVLMRDHHVLERYRYLIGLGGVALLLATMVFGTTINGSRLWIELPGGQTIQLTELSKVLIVIFLAGYLRDKRELLAIPTRRIGPLPVPPMAALGPALLVLLASLLVIAVLNDFGTGILFFGVFIAMLYLATGRAVYPLIGAVGMVLGAVLVWLAVPRIQDRVDAWLFPFDDAQGLGYQSVQSIYALAEGGVLGPGLGRGFLVTADGATVIPALETDFIFSAVSTELGYLGGVALLLVYLLIVQRGISIAAAATDGFSKLLAGGLTALIGIQAILIVGGVVRLVPLTGVTLPFMSYGGSSVVTNFGLVAILLVVSHRSRAETRTGRR